MCGCEDSKLSVYKNLKTHFKALELSLFLEMKDVLDARKYWSVLKTRLKKEGSEVVTKCDKLKLVANDGKRYLTDVADTEQLFRLIFTLI